MKRILLNLMLVLIGSGLMAQTEGVSINPNGNDPDPSAILDISSSEKGLLIPRMDSMSRVSILNPAQGLVVYDSTAHSFWYFNGTNWEQVGRAGTIQGTDGNALNLRPIDEGPTAGNARGEYSVDLQTTRTNASEVASADYAVISGGSSNSATGYGSSVAGGALNTASGRMSFIGGGTQNTAPSFGEAVLGIHSELYTPASVDTFNPNDRLFVVGNGTSSSNPSNALTLLKNGNLGLGTTTPDTTLHLVGQLRYEDGNEQAGYVLTSDADGKANWQSKGRLIAPDIAPDFSCSSRVDSLSGPFTFVTSGNYLYAGKADSLLVYDISDPSNMSFMGGTLTGPLGLRKMVVQGTYVYTINTNGGNMSDLEIFDVSDPTAPALLGTVSSGPLARSLAVSGNYAYVVDLILDELRVIDVSDPSAPSIVSILTVGTANNLINDIDVSGNYVYIVGPENLFAVDISNPASPFVVDVEQYGSGSSSTDISISGNYAYILDGNFLMVYDITTPTNLTEVADLLLGVWFSADNMTIQGDYAYVVAPDGISLDNDRLKLIDIRNPTNPSIVGSFEAPGQGFRDVGVSGDHIFMLDITTVPRSILIITLACREVAVVFDPFTGNLVSGNGPSNIGEVLNQGNDANAQAITNLSGLEVNGSIVTQGITLQDGNQQNSYVMTSDANGVASWQAPTLNTDGQTLSLNGTQLSITNGNSVTLPPDGDSDPGNELQTLALSGSTLSISNGNSLTLPPDGDSDPSNEIELPVGGANGQILQTDGNGNYSWKNDSLGGIIVQGTDGNSYNLRPGEQFTAIGDARGEFSVDLQLFRNSLDQVASGNSATISGGRENRASAFYTTVSGGRSNWAAAQYATVNGGTLNLASGDFTTISGGSSNQATGSSAVIGGGFSNVASGNNSTIPGGQNLLAESLSETALGAYNIGSGGSATTWVGTDPILTVGNGQSPSTRSTALTVLKNGNVGIGTTNPTLAKVQISGGPTASLGNVGFLPLSGNTGNGPAPATYQYSLYADQRIAALEVFAHSDRRIKNIQGISDAKTDLSTLMQIEVTDYRLKDSIAKGTHAIKKVIAQQVAEVYPQAVNTDLTEVVPDIYQRAEMQDGWIMLATDLKVGERVKLITEKASEVYEVSAVEANRFQVSGLASRLSQQSDLASQVFVYGREVKDFHTVDYEALSMLNVSATQEQQRRIEALEAENAALKTQVQQLQSLEARLQALEASVVQP